MRKRKWIEIHWIDFYGGDICLDSAKYGQWRDNYDLDVLPRLVYDIEEKYDCHFTFVF